MSWLRLYTDLINDPKVMRLECKLFRSWISCLCLAKRHDGILPDVATISFALRLKEETAMQHIEALIKANLLDETGDGLKPHNWDSRQFRSDVSAERTKKWRDKKRAVSVTSPRRPQSTESETESDAEPERVTPQPAFEPFGDGPDPEQVIGDVVEQMAAVWPSPGNVPRAKLVAIHEFSSDCRNISEFTEAIRRSFVAWLQYHTAERLISPRHFVPFLERWFTDRDYARPAPAPRTAEPKTQRKSRFGREDDQ